MREDFLTEWEECEEMQTNGRRLIVPAGREHQVAVSIMGITRGYSFDFIGDVTAPVSGIAQRATPGFIDSPFLTYSVHSVEERLLKASKV